jgi:hypothetical protein
VCGSLSMWWTLSIALTLAIGITLLLLVPAIVMTVREEGRERRRTNLLIASLRCPACGGLFEEWDGGGLDKRCRPA